MQPIPTIPTVTRTMVSVLATDWDIRASALPRERVITTAAAPLCSSALRSMTHSITHISHQVSPILPSWSLSPAAGSSRSNTWCRHKAEQNLVRSEEHTSELQSRENLVCRLL